MLTLFTSARPFRGHTAVIQRNALRSWTLLHPAVQIILFGDAEGSQEVAWELGIHYEENPQVTASGSVRLDYMFTNAHRCARYSTLCYVPCDTVLLPDFCDALTRVEALHREFLMVGRSCDLHVNMPLSFGDSGWHSSLRRQTQMAGRQIFPDRAAYVAFSRGACLADIPPLPIDSPYGTEWLLWKALSDQVPVVDASEMALAVQQHGDPDDSFCSGSETAQSVAESLALCGGDKHLRTVANAPYLLTAVDVVRNRWRRWHSWRAQAVRWRFRVPRAWQEVIWQLRRLSGTAVLQDARGNGASEAKDAKPLVVKVLTK
jgi:hypothetical protein